MHKTFRVLAMLIHIVSIVSLYYGVYLGTNGNGISDIATPTVIALVFFFIVFFARKAIGIVPMLFIVLYSVLIALGYHQPNSNLLVNPSAGSVYIWIYSAGSIISTITAFVLSKKRTKQTSAAPHMSAITMYNSCPYFSKKLNMCIKTDEFISPAGNRYGRYCTSSNCTACPNFD